MSRWCSCWPCKLDEQVAEALQEPHRGRRVVDEDPVAARSPQLALDDELAVVEPMAGFIEQRRDRPRPVDLEEGLDDGALLAGADQVRLRAGADDEQDRVDHDGLAGPGLTGQHVEAGRQRHHDLLDDRQIADAEFPQHGDAGCRGPPQSRLQPNARRQAVRA